MTAPKPKPKSKASNTQTTAPKSKSKPKSLPRAKTTTTIRNKTGMHVRPVSQFVQKASSFKSKVQLKAKGKTVDAKSVLLLASLGLIEGTEITIIAEGTDALKAVTELKNLVDSGFDEM